MNKNACYEIDRVLRTMLIERRPGYLMLPADVAKQRTTPPNDILIVPLSEPESSVAEAFRYHARERLLDSPRVALLADVLAQRFGLQPGIATLDGGNADGPRHVVDGQRAIR